MIEVTYIFVYMCSKPERESGNNIYRCLVRGAGIMNALYNALCL